MKTGRLKVKHNTIHNEYRLPLGLYFRLVFNHISHPGKWLVLSNIPAMHHLKLDVASKEEAVLFIMAKIEKELGILKVESMKTMKIIITVIALAVVIATAAKLGDKYLSLLMLVYIIVGYALCEMWHLKKTGK